MSKVAVAAVLAVVSLCIGSLAVCANGGNAAAVKSKPTKQSPYEMCAAYYKLQEKKGGIYYGQWVLNMFVLRNHNKWPKGYRPKSSGKPILSPQQYAKLERTCHYQSGRTCIGTT